MEKQEQQNEPQTNNIQIPSANNIASNRPLIPISFAVVLICFFFTFCELRCASNGQKLASLTGIELVTGTHLKDHDMFSGQERKGEKIPANFWAIISLGAAVIGCGAFLIKEKKEAAVGTVVGAIGVGSLLILQFALKGAMEKKGEGQLEVDFQLAYWISLFSMSLGGFMSYLRMKAMNYMAASLNPRTVPINENISIESESSDTSHFDQIKSIPQAEKVNEFDIIKWFSYNSKFVFATGISALVIFGLYYFFIRKDAERDGKSAAISQCKCVEKANAGNIKANEEFLSSFDSNNFKKRQEARNKLMELKNPVNIIQIECSNKSQAKYIELRNRYITDQEEIKKFEFAYNAQNGICNPSNQAKLTSTYTEVESKIVTIRDPEPDMDKIKTDLIGQKIQGWSFDYLKEFKTAEIVNTTKGRDRLEYQVKFHLIGTNSEHDCEVMVVYIQGEQGWYFNNVRMVYITYDNNIPADDWFRLSPLQNCSWNCEDTYKLVWKTYEWGSEIISGPDARNVILPSSNTYLIKSREGHPVTVKFTYKPRK